MKMVVIVATALVATGALAQTAPAGSAATTPMSPGMSMPDATGTPPTDGSLSSSPPRSPSIKHTRHKAHRPGTSAATGKPTGDPSGTAANSGSSTPPQ